MLDYNAKTNTLNKFPKSKLVNFYNTKLKTGQITEPGVVFYLR